MTRAEPRATTRVTEPPTPACPASRMTRDQQRATMAFIHVKALVEPEHARYGALALKLPILVRTAGLCQALHFVHSRNDAAAHRLLEHLAAQLRAIDPAIDGMPGLCEQVRTAAMQPYLHLTREATAVLQWYARFARSILKVKPEAP